MANRYFVGDVDSSWNDASNWSQSDGDDRLATSETVNTGSISSGSYQDTWSDCLLYTSPSPRDPH